MAKKTNKTTKSGDLTSHPMYTPSDLAYLRDKGYSDEEIRAFWDRDRAQGHEPLEHRPVPDLMEYLARRSVKPGQDLAQTLERIAKTHLDVPTLQERKMDDLDFHSIGVVGLRRALEAAYQAGLAAAETRLSKTSK